MKKILIIGGSKGIGHAILQQQLENNTVFTISRNAPELTHPNLTHFSLDVLQDTLPEIESLDTVIYCPGSITLKPIGSLSIDDFRNDFEINVIGAVKVIKKYLPILKKGNRPSWQRAAGGEVSRPLFAQFVDKLSAALGKPVATGIFGADMQVSLVNDGPVTLTIDSKWLE